MSVKNKLRNVFGVLIVLAISVVFLIYKFRLKIEIPFLFGYLDPLVFLILGKIMRKSIQFFMTKILERKKKKDSISNFQLLIIFFWDNWHKYINIIEYNFGKKFPIFFFKICKYCDKFIMWNYDLSLSPKISDKIIYQFLLKLYIYPAYLGLFVDFYLQVWHFLFWGMVLSYFIYFVKVILVWRWGEMYFFWLKGKV
jgi:hypothetical protein